MFQRILNPSQNNSFFLFGPRGTGKSTLLRGLFTSEKAKFIDLLDPFEEDRLSRDPAALLHELTHESAKYLEWVVIDEVQKLPRLLDTVHKLIESTQLKFALTGSSARKLKRGHANLLAGRAFVYSLHPLTFLEIGNAFDLNTVLQFGTLPQLFQLADTEARQMFLRTYALTYLKEEIQAEQIIRNLDPFRSFLEIAAQTNGQIINYQKIANDVSVDIKTVISYFSVLCDTLIGFLLPPFHHSIRKRQRQNPKFYFFDLGVKRALDRSLTLSLLPKTYEYGRAFEHWVILECIRLQSYQARDFQFSYLRTKDGAEIDLIVERPGRPTALVEIKSSQQITEKEVAILERFTKDFKNAEAFCWSQDPKPKKIGCVEVLPWQMGIKTLLG